MLNRFILLLAISLCASAQQQPTLQQILDRLEKLEQENKQLKTEVRQLRELLEGPVAPVADVPKPSIEERLEVAEKRIDEQAQTKVEASQKFPVQITGMAVANLYAIMRHNNGADFSTSAGLLPSRMNSALSIKQSVIGLKFIGPMTIAGARVSGNIFVDFFDGTIEGNALPPRIRTGAIDFDWTSTSLRFGYEKPIFSPREPNSLATLGISPLTGAGNLWRWQPQVRLEQRFKMGEATDLKAQVGVMQTSEDLGSANALLVDRRRPAIQGRFQLSHQFGEGRRIEIATGFSTSQSHVRSIGASVPSRLISVDWLVAPFSKLEWTGIFWSGENIQHMGAFRNGLRVLPDNTAIPVHTQGGWTQFSVLPTDRITLNFMAGIHDDRNSDLLRGQNARNRQGAANIMFRLAPNVVLSFEAVNIKTLYLGLGNRVNQRYDLAIAYLF